MVNALIGTMIYYNALLLGIFLGFLTLGYGYFLLTSHHCSNAIAMNTMTAAPT